MDLICLVLQLYFWVIIARVIFSWIRVTPGTPVASVYSVIFNLTEPVLGPLRRAIPPRAAGNSASNADSDQRFAVFSASRCRCGRT